jgi:hypothetical protein
VLSTWQVLAFAVIALLVIAAWVRTLHGTRAATIMLGLAATTLGVVWIAYEAVPLEQWRQESLPVGLAIFALPALAGTAIAVTRSRRARAPLDMPAVAYLVLLWVTPAVLLYVSQRRPFTGEFANLLWWAASTCAIYVLVPVAYARMTSQSVRGYGLSVKFVRAEATVVALIAPVALIIVWLVSADERFLATYPFYSGDGWSLLAFEAAYGATFVALEFFFRGFLVFAGQPVLGIHAVPVMAFAYCLLHLGKPLPEAVSSLLGGLILGYLALRLRSILAGVVAHLTMAWGMDAAVLHRSSA